MYEGPPLLTIKRPSRRPSEAKIEAFTGVATLSGRTQWTDAARFLAQSGIWTPLCRQPSVDRH